MKSCISELSIQIKLFEYRIELIELKMNEVNNNFYPPDKMKLWLILSITSYSILKYSSGSVMEYFDDSASEISVSIFLFALCYLG